MKRLVLIPAILLTSSLIFAQTAIKSVEEDYFDFLSLQGLIERPTLNYRTLSDAQWNVKQIEDTDHLWKNNNLGTTFDLLKVNTPSENWYLKGVKQGIFFNVFGPQWYNSFNTTSPYGQNDGALWQGRGYNTSFTTGARLEGYGLELTFKPQLSFSQNMKWDYKTPEGFNSAQYQNLAKEYGYFWGVIDKPQMFGSSPFWTYDWGDTEVRYTWHNLTVGFGTETIWLGPAYRNPMLHSNNAPTYPKFDMGLRKQKVIIPGLNLDLGYIEGRIWVGRLSESAWYDNIDDNNYRLISGFNASYAPSFIPGLTLGLNKICLAKWNNKAWKYLNPFYDDNDVSGPGEDQKMSITANWIFPAVGFEVYGEIALDDYSSDIVSNPFHTLTWASGLKKIFDWIPNNNIKFELICELSNMEMSQDFQLQWNYFGLYGHHQITQGYTNKGQIMGNGTTLGGDSQYIALKMYHPLFEAELFFNRFTPDRNYTLNKAVTVGNNDVAGFEFCNYEVHMCYGGNASFFVTKDFLLTAGGTIEWTFHAQYQIKQYGNYHFNLGAKYMF